MGKSRGGTKLEGETKRKERSRGKGMLTLPRRKSPIRMRRGRVRTRRTGRKGRKSLQALRMRIATVPKRNQRRGKMILRTSLLQREKERRSRSPSEVHLVMKAKARMKSRRKQRQRRRRRAIAKRVRTKEQRKLPKVKGGKIRTAKRRRGKLKRNQ